MEGVDSGGSAKVAQFAVAGGGGVETDGHEESVTGEADVALVSIGWGAGLKEGCEPFDKGIPACIRLFCLENISFGESCLEFFRPSPYFGCGESCRRTLSKRYPVRATAGFPKQGRKLDNHQVSF
jgi:hypothetical protein